MCLVSLRLLVLFSLLFSSAIFLAQPIRSQVCLMVGQRVMLTTIIIIIIIMIIIIIIIIIIIRCVLNCMFHSYCSIILQLNRLKMVVTSKDTTTVPLGKSASLAPGLVRPRHITCAPLKRNFIAPLSTC